MYHVDTTTAVTSRPAVKPLVSKARLYYTNGNPSMGVPATILEADHLNTLQEEMLNVIHAAQLEPDKLDDKQLLKAMRWMLAKALGREEWNETDTAAGPSIPVWKPDFDYAVPFAVFGADNELYTAMQASGPGTRNGAGAVVGAKDPTTTTGFWKSYRNQVSGDAGDIKFFSCRPAALKKPWVFANGDTYALDSAIGKALLALPAALKQDWRIVQDAAGINVPSLFSGSSGYFPRAVNGTTRMPGSIEQDAARPVTASASSSGNTSFSGGVVGSFASIVHPKDIRDTPTTQVTATGVFSASGAGVFNYGEATDPNGPYGYAKVNMSLNSLTGDTRVSTSVTVSQANQGTENRPINIGFTPAIYLPGV